MTPFVEKNGEPSEENRRGIVVRDTRQNTITSIVRSTRSGLIPEHSRSYLIHRLGHPPILPQEPATLMVPQPRIEAVPGEQFGVGALFDDASIVHDNESIHRRNRGQPMGDGDDGFALHHFIEAFLNGHFDFRIQRAGRLVQ